MNGQKIVLAGVNFNDSSLPIIRDDPMLSAGSLFLFDPSHSAGAFDGLPAAGGLVPNVAWKEAAALMGGGSVGSLSGFVVTQNAETSAAFKVERTSKGGIHGIPSQVNQQAGQNYSYIVRLPAAIRDRILANLGNDYYISLWHRCTRANLAASGNQSPFHYVAAGGATSNYLFHMQGGDFAPSSGPNHAGSRRSPGNDTQSGTGPQITAGGVLNATGNGPGGTTIDLGVGVFGAWGSLNINKAASRVLYRAYVEDLTVSGRTYAEADALDYRLWQEAFAPGGRFSNDTWTSPATLP